MIRTYPEQLNQSLQKKLAKLYFLVGQDPLLLNECKDAIHHNALVHGFDEKQLIEIENSTNWNDIFDRCQSIGLFFNKQVLTLVLPETLNANLQKHLLELISLLNDDILLVLQLPKLAKSTEKQKWFEQANQYEPQAVLVNCQTPSIEQLPRWIQQRAKAMSLQIDESAIQLLCYNYENNLLALKQNLQLLALLYPEGKLNYQRIQATVESCSVFTPFQWTDALLEGKLNRAKRILEELQSEEVQPIILLRTLQKDVLTLLELAKPQQKFSLNSALPVHQLRENFDRLKVWQNRRPFFTQAFQRLTYAKLYEIIQCLANIERQAKQEFSSDVWQELMNITMLICQHSGKEKVRLN
ncbi:DNA polymerase III subunit delta [[Haemophilus] felis]|uniref:DNA polymerase III subunit delta n=1 Tax=[Haemophilus] felis TaxID=123822 RepID=A0A1T0B0Q0_9PAST|nr:DNA polymerase III subunit delta [[Haemophilus] felis]NBI40115.1 DNA polymerase III subunit delta [[Haemophilus] felis]OOS03489.1 DNA polymerase III subunit delta [[Haemophilus] felis]